MLLSYISPHFCQNERGINIWELLNYTFKKMVSHFVLRASTCKAGLSHRTYSGVSLDDCIEIGPFLIMDLIMVRDNLYGNRCTLSQ